jgi:antirepressor protein
MSNLITVPFHNQNVIATLISDVPHIAMKPICENIGIGWQSQFNRIKRHPVMNKGVVMMNTTGKDGKKYNMLMLPLKMLNGWLFGIDSNRAKPEIKDRLIEYQEECFDVLANHFIPKQYDLKELPEPPVITKAQQGELFSLVAAKAVTSGKTNAYYWSRFNNHFKTNGYKNLPADKFDEGKSYLERLEGDSDKAFFVLTQEEIDTKVKQAAEGELLPLANDFTGIPLLNPYNPMPPTTNRDYYTACSRLSNLKNWARKNHSNVMVDDLEAVEQCFEASIKLTNEQATQQLRKVGYLVAPANKSGLQTLLLDWIPASLFYDLVDLVAWRVRSTKHPINGSND